MVNKTNFKGVAHVDVNNITADNLANIAITAKTLPGFPKVGLVNYKTGEVKYEPVCFLKKRRLSEDWIGVDPSLAVIEAPLGTDPHALHAVFQITSVTNGKVYGRIAGTKFRPGVIASINA